LGEAASPFLGETIGRYEKALKELLDEEKVTDFFSLGLRGPHTPLWLPEKDEFVIANMVSDTLLFLNEEGKITRAFLGESTGKITKDALKEVLDEGKITDLSSFGLHAPQTPLWFPKKKEFVVANYESDTLLFLDEEGNLKRAFVGERTTDSIKDALKEELGEEKITDLSSFGLHGPITPLWLPEKKEFVIVNGESDVILFLTPEGEVANVMMGKRSSEYIDAEALEAVSETIRQTRLRELDAELTRLQDAIGEQERILAQSLGAVLELPTVRLITEEVKEVFRKAKEARKSPEEKELQKIVEKELAELEAIEEKAVDDPETAWDEFEAKFSDFEDLGIFLRTHQRVRNIFKRFMDKATALNDSLKASLVVWRKLPLDERARRRLPFLTRELATTQSHIY